MHDEEDEFDAEDFHEHDGSDAKRDADFRCGHDGYALRPTASLFAEPTPALGQIYSADSTTDRVKPPRSALRRIIYGLIVGFICTGWIGIIPIFEPSPLDVLWYGVAVLSLGGGVYHVWTKTKYEAETNYVGQRGIERYLVRDRIDAPQVCETLLFAEAAELRGVIARMMLQGAIHTFTQFEYVWTDSRQNKIFEIKGSFGVKELPIKQGHVWHFAQAAERAWTDFVYQRLLQEYERKRYFEFPIEKGAAMLVGDGFLEYRTPESSFRIQAIDLEKAELVDGWFTFTSREAIRFGNIGKIKFHFGKLANAEAFVLAICEFLDLDPHDFTGTSSPAIFGAI